MATPLGTNELTSLSERFVMPTLTDNVYRSNLLTFRMVMRNKKLVQGGLHVEVPLIYSKMAAGGPYQGYEQLNITPQDVVKSAAFDWKQYYSFVTVDGLTQLRSDSPQSIVNHLVFKFEIAQMDLADKLGDGLWSDGSNVKALDGVQGAVDDGGVLVTYGGLSRTTNTWWRSQDDSTTTILSFPAMQSMFGNCTEGGRHPTLIVTTQANYNRYVALNSGGQAFPTQPGGHDEQLAAAGFTNLLFNNVPVTVDSKCTTNHVYFLNETYWDLVVASKVDFRMKEFREPVDQDAMTSLILWAGTLICRNPARQGKLSAITA